jgi:hypothetical protein
MGTYSDYEIESKVRNPQLKELAKEIMDISSGHDHDGVNSKAVTTGAPANGSVTNAILATDVKVGSLAAITTTANGNVVAAINELDAENGDLSTLTTSATTLAGAINEIDAGLTTATATANGAASVAALADAAADAAAAAVASAASLTGAQTLTNKTLTAVKIATTDGIFDAGGDEYMVFTEATTPKTYIGVASGDTGVAPRVIGAGETNTDLHLHGSGTGNVVLSDGTDTTKILYFEVAGATAGKDMKIVSSQTDDRVLTLPDATDTLVGKATTDVLSNKTLTLPQINDTSADHQYVFAVSELTADRTVTLPLLTGADEFVFKDHAQTLTNKTLTTPKIATGGYIADAAGDEYIKFVADTTPVTHIQVTSGDTTVKPIIQAVGETNIGLQLQGNGTGNVTIVDGDTPTKAVEFELVSAAASTMTTLAISQTVNRTITLPDATDTLVGKATTDTLTNKTLDSAGTGNVVKNVVLAYAGNITRAEMITGKTLVADRAGVTIKVLSVKMLVNGAFDGGAGTSFILRDSGTPVVILTALKAALTDGAKISTEGLAIANVTEGAGMVGALTAAKGIVVAADAAWDAGTSIDIAIQYMYT